MYRHGNRSVTTAVLRGFSEEDVVRQIMLVAMVIINNELEEQKGAQAFSAFLSNTEVELGLLLWLSACYSTLKHVHTCCKHNAFEIMHQKMCTSI